MKTKLTKSQSLLLLLLLLSSSFFSPSAGADTLSLADLLVDRKTLVSAGGRFEFGFFSPAGSSGNQYVGIWYHNISMQTVVWVANRATPIIGGAGNVSINSNGTIIVSDQNNSVVWSSTTATGLANPVAQLLDSGNLVVREADGAGGSVAWQSFDHPTDTVLPGMKFGWNPVTGQRNLTSWTSADDPAPGEYVAAMDLHGYPQVTLWGGSRLLWQSGPWNGLRFSGVPEQMNVNMFIFVFVDETDEIYYMIKMRDPSVFFRIIVTESGITQGLVWIEQSKIWNAFWSAPKDQCDAARPCGAYGVCNPNDWPICHCIQGFEPENPTNWVLRDSSDGCRRKSELDCRNQTDGFLMVSGVKLPETSSSTVDLSMSLDNCRVQCLRNCSCTGYASSNISIGSVGCIFWFTDLVGMREYTMGGQDLYVRVAASDLGSKHRKSSVVVSAAIGCAVAILIIAFIVIFGVKRKNRKNRKRRALLGNTISFSEHSIEDRKEGKDLDLPLYDFDVIADATDGFSIGNKLGEGGFGPVYKGKLDEQEIAVKRLAKTSVQGIDEFKNEVMLIAKLQHRNLVRLLGCCIQGEERMLIYEYMYNKSLDAFLFDKAKSALLDWQTRYKIITGVARGLLYLHQDSRFRIIHRDLKASNILLDKDMNPKISDFGMARIFGGDETEVNTRRVVGTYGYMSPEYAMDGIFSVKSDVFSFGVLVLEIVSGKRNRGVYLYEHNQNLLGQAWSLWKEGNALELVDQPIGLSYPMAEALRCIKVGLLCVQERPEDRPTMSSIALMLSSESSFLPHPKQPGYVATKGPSETNSTSSKQNSISVNEISVTIFEGR